MRPLVLALVLLTGTHAAHADVLTDIKRKLWPSHYAQPVPPVDIAPAVEPPPVVGPSEDIRAPEPRPKPKTARPGARPQPQRQPK